MKRVKKTDLRDLFLSLILGIGFSGIMGFLTGLRVLDMTPDLAVDFRNIFFLLISSMYLYAILGAAVGLLLWIFIWILSRITSGGFHGRKFVSPWVTLYLISAGALSVYFALTRQDLRTGNFDNALLLGYYLTVLIFGILLIRSARPQTNKLTGKRNRLTLGRFWGILLLYIVILVGVTLVSTNSRDNAATLGDPAEIKAALEEPNADVRIAIIGWDGGEWSVIEDLLQRGYLPNLQKMIDNGVSAPFRSLPSTKSPLVWTSIATGKVPAKHGIIDFGSFQFPGMVNNFAVYPDGLGYYRLISRFMRKADLPVTSSTRRCQSFWNILTDAEISTGIVGWWASWPAEPIDGFIVSDRFTYTLFNPNASAQTLQFGQTYPPDALEEVSQFCRIPDSITEEEYARFMPLTRGQVVHPASWEQNQYQDWNPLYQFRLAYTAAESFKEAGLYLYEKHRPSMFGIYFQGIDMVSHFFWQYYRPFDYVDVPQSDVEAFGQVIPEFYRYMDETLGEILNTLEPGTDVMVMSDHGFGFDLNPAITYRTGEHRV
ncbi:alkaline phosphatase family protein, partial [bacterium]|nr:alkaline phosphatase family protein [bacterium]